MYSVLYVIFEVGLIVKAPSKNLLVAREDCGNTAPGTTYYDTDLY